MYAQQARRAAACAPRNLRATTGRALFSRSTNLNVRQDASSGVQEVSPMPKETPKASPAPAGKKTPKK